MTTSERLKKVLSEKGPKFDASADFAELQKFYHDMQRKGLVLKPQYSLPKLDTIGRSIYHRVRSS